MFWFSNVINLRHPRPYIVYDFEEEGSGDPGGKFDQYVRCVYWAVQSLTSVGYGDMSGYSSNATVRRCAEVQHTSEALNPPPAVV